MNEPGPVRRFFGGLLMVMGGLIALSSGTCTVVVTVMEMAPRSGSGGIHGIMPMVLLFGVVPFAIGAGLFFFGRSLFRGPKGQPDAGGS